jgi:endonuclease/exonuclease/phosphatase family metal-dependent hydrolase
MLLLVTHLGNGGPQVQLEEVLSLLPASGDVAMLGDFNFRPYQPQYALVTDRFEDAWAKRWPSGVEAGGAEWPERIDYVFLSPGMDVITTRYVEDGSTDHPALVVEIAW